MLHLRVIIYIYLSRSFLIQVLWEPLVEPWSVSSVLTVQNATGAPTIQDRTTVKVSSSEKLNINITESLVQVTIEIQMFVLLVYLRFQAWQSVEGLNLKCIGRTFVEKLHHFGCRNCIRNIYLVKRVLYKYIFFVMSLNFKMVHYPGSNEPLKFLGL